MAQNKALAGLGLLTTFLTSLWKEIRRQGGGRGALEYLTNPGVIREFASILIARVGNTVSIDDDYTGASFTLNTGSPSMPEDWREDGWKVREHRPFGCVRVTFRNGEMYLDDRKAVDYFSNEQRYDSWIEGRDLDNEIANEDTLPDNILDFLIEKQDEPEVARFLERYRDCYLFFWGTIYQDPSGHFAVRYLFLDERWRSGKEWLDRTWSNNSPALVLEPKV